MKLVNHPAAVALGLVTLFTYPLTGPLISPDHIFAYHLDGTAAATFLPVLVYSALEWLVWTAVLVLAAKPGRIRVIVWSGLISMLPWLLLKIWTMLLDWDFPHPLSRNLFGFGLVGFAALVLCWRPSFLPAFERTQSFTATILTFISLTGLLVFTQVAWFGWQARNLNTSVSLRPHSPTTATAAKGPGHIPHQRIIWILFDELSFRQVYEQRYPDLQLPAFDRLAREAAVFTHVIPIGLKTEYVVPSLFTGTASNALRSSADGTHVLLRNAELQNQNQNQSQSQWQPFDAHRTVFQDALDRGYSNAIAGWYHPYCRLFPQMLDHCFWEYHNPALESLSTHQSFAHNLVTPLASLWESTGGLWRSRSYNPLSNTRHAQEHIDDYHDLATAADTFLNDSSADFLYIHMPIPHPFGIYNRHTRQLTTGPSTYLDNLALADVYLAHVRAELERRGEWDSSTVILMGDHSWRTTLIWRAEPSWTQEEQRATDGGQFDDRPGYIVKLPHQQQPATIDAPFAAIRTRALLDAIMDHRIQTPQDLTTWVNTQPSAQNR
jgi:Sulfatase